MLRPEGPGLVGTHMIALTFDDGPNLNTPAVLDALREAGVKGTFFIVGKMARTYPDILARIAAKGFRARNYSTVRGKTVSSDTASS